MTASVQASIMQVFDPLPPFVRAMRAASVWPLCAAVFLAPYVVWRLSSTFFLTISDGLFILGAGLMLAGRGIHSRPLVHATPYWLLAICILLGGLLLGSIVNGDPLRWLIAAIQYSFAYVIIPFILMGDDEQRAELYGMAMLAGVFCMELFASVMYYTWSDNYADFYAFGPEFVTGAWRLGAFMGQPNWNGAVIAMVMPFALYFGTTGRLPPYVVYPVCLTLVLGLVLSASFTGFTSTMIGIALFLVLGGNRNAMKVVLGAAVAIGLVFMSGFELPRVFQGRVADALETGEMSQAGTFSARMDLVKEAWEIVDNTMLIGIGVDEYREISEGGHPVHNSYLLIWAEGGLIALLGWLFMLTVPLLSALSVYRINRQAAALGVAVYAGFLIYTTAATHMYARVWIMPLMVSMGIVFSKLSNENNMEQAE